MLPNLIALVSGILFGAGLGISQMVNPVKVMNFLDITGSWDPSLALVMGFAVVIFFISWRISIAQLHPLLNHKITIPLKTRIFEPQLLVGSSIFGVGWGIVGLCPGPSISSIAYLMPQTVIFILSMAAGIYFANWLLPKIFT